MALATAHVEVLADTKKFEPDLQRKLRNSGANAGKLFGRQFSTAMSNSVKVDKALGDQMSRAGTQAGRSFGKQFGKTASRHVKSANLNLKGTIKVATKQGTSAGKAFSTAFGKSAGRNQGLGKMLSKGLGKGLIAPISLLGKSATTILSSITDIGGRGPAAFSALAASAGAAVTAVAPLTGILAAIPAALAGVGASAAVIATAFSGMGEALSAGWSGDLEEFQQALDGLAPSAQAVTKDLLGLKPALQDLQGSVQEAFFGRLTGQFEMLEKVISQYITPGMENFADTLGVAAGEVVAFLSSAQGGSAIQSVFDGLSESVTQLLPAIQPLLQGITDMAAAGAGSLGGIAPVLEAMGNAMSNFATGGGLNEMLSGAGEAAKTLGDAFQALWPGLKAMGSVFGVIGDQARDLLVPVFQTVSDVLVALAPVFGEVARTIGGVLGAALPPVAEALKGMAQIAAALLLPTLEKMGPRLVDVAEQLGPKLTDAIRNLMPHLIALAEQIGNGLAFAIEHVLPVIISMLPVVVSTFSRIVSAIRGALQFIGGILTFFKDLFTGNWEGLWSSVGDILRGAWEAIGSFIMMKVESILNKFRFLRDGALGLLNLLKSGIIGIFGDSDNWLVQAGKNIVQGLINGIKAMSGPVGDAASFIAGKVRGFFPFSPAKEGPLSGSGSPDKSGRKVASMFASGLRSNHGAVGNALRDVLANPSLSSGTGAVNLAGSPAAAGAAGVGGLPLGINGDNGGRVINNTKTTTVSAPITVRSNGADPARVARRTADRLARVSTA